MAGIREAVGAALGEAVTAAEPVGGGCISDAHRVALASGEVLLAKPAAGLPAGLLDVEAEGLAWLRAAGAIGVPAVRAATGDVLVIEYVTPGPRNGATDERLGRGLAGLHRAGADGFGWHRDGWIGRIAQRNTPHGDDWPEFWFTRRVEPLARVARDQGAVDERVPALVTRLADRLPELAGPPERPARVHGDLWSGNVLVDRAGAPWVIDPAAYGGHREVDLAMLHLFGSPSPAVTAAYDEVWPLADGWRDRLRLWQLEPLLTHTVMFGGGYGAQVRAVLEAFT